MNTLPGPDESRRIVDQLEEDVVDVDSVVARDAEVSADDEVPEVAGSPEPTD